MRMQLVITKLKVGSSSDIIFCVKMKLLISRINCFYICQLNLTAINQCAFFCMHICNCICLNLMHMHLTTSVCLHV